MATKKQITQIVKQVVKATTTSKAKVNPKLALTSFMTKKGYKVQSEKKVKYETKAGVQKEGLKLSFDNGKSYMVGEQRFWKLN